MSDDCEYLQDRKLIAATLDNLADSQKELAGEVKDFRGETVEALGEIKTSVALLSAKMETPPVKPNNWVSYAKISAVVVGGLVAVVGGGVAVTQAGIAIIPPVLALFVGG